MIQSLAARKWNSGYNTGLHQLFDLINIMTYGQNDGKEGGLANLRYFQDGANFWKNDMRSPISKLTVGVPFWAESWNPGDVDRNGNPKEYTC